MTWLVRRTRTNGEKKIVEYFHGVRSMGVGHVLARVMMGVGHVLARVMTRWVAEQKRAHRFEERNDASELALEFEDAARAALAVDAADPYLESSVPPDEVVFEVVRLLSKTDVELRTLRRKTAELHAQVDAAAAQAVGRQTATLQAQVETFGEGSIS